jgi:serine/threonine protein kinase
MPPISPERWRLLSPYLDQALDVPADRLSSWLQSLAARDAALAADLNTVLAQQRAVQQAHFLEHAVLDPRLVRSASLEGQVLGSYRLVSPIGEGGSGSVWLAERCDGRFHGRAAVKLLNVSRMGAAGEERFRREGTILAHLRHPRIAHLIDAGLTPGGQPYLDLEHVDGQTIDR